MVDSERVPLSPVRQMYQSVPEIGQQLEMSRYQGMLYDRSPNNFYHDQYYLGRGTQYQTLPTRKTPLYLRDPQPERSVTPDITRGLERNDRHHQTGGYPVYEKSTNFHDQNRYSRYKDDSLLNQKLGIPVAMPQLQHYPYTIHSNENIAPRSPLRQHVDEVDYSLRISPIDPRNSAGFQSSTPSQIQPLKSAMNLESRILSPKKSTMSNEELYAVIHKSKKKLNIQPEDDHRASPVDADMGTQIEKLKSPESGYLGDKIRSRLSWSPNSPNETVEITPSRTPPNESRSRQSWACNERKKVQQTSRLDFKKLLLQKSTNLLTSNAKKPSAVEQLKLSKQQLQQRPFSPPVQPPEMNILELSGSPRSLVNRRFVNPPGSPKNTADKLKPPKLMSPRSQWRFASPRSDVLSSTILEDCREDETNSSGEKKPSPVRLETKFQQKPTKSTNFNEDKSEAREKYLQIAQRIQARRAEFFKTGSNDNGQLSDTSENAKIPALETSF